MALLWVVACLCCIVVASGAPARTRTFRILVPKYDEDLEKRCSAFPIFMGAAEEAKVYNVTSSVKWVEEDGNPLSYTKQAALNQNISVRFLLHS
jgi:hypothetical protein